MSSEIIAVLRELAAQFGIVINWADENVQPFVEELIVKIAKYEIYTSIVWIVLSIIIFIVCIYAVRTTYKPLYIDGGYSQKDIYQWICVICAVAIVIFTIVIVQQAHDIIRAIVMPEYTFVLEVKEVLGK